MVDVEEGALCPFEEDAVAVAGELMQDLRDVRGHRRNLLGRL